MSRVDDEIAAEFGDDPILAALQSPTPAATPRRGRPPKARSAVRAAGLARAVRANSQAPADGPPLPVFVPESQLAAVRAATQPAPAVEGDAIAAALAQIEATRAELLARRREYLEAIAQIDREDVRLGSAAAALRALRGEDTSPVTVPELIRLHAATLEPGPDGTARIDPGEVVKFARTTSREWPYKQQPYPLQHQLIMQNLARLARKGEVDKRPGTANYYTWRQGRKGEPGVAPLVAGAVS